MGNTCSCFEGPMAMMTSPLLNTHVKSEDSRSRKAGDGTEDECCSTAACTSETCEEQTAFSQSTFSRYVGCELMKPEFLFNPGEQLIQKMMALRVMREVDEGQGSYNSEDSHW